mgnify:CR=1 FL=1
MAEKRRPSQKITPALAAHIRFLVFEQNLYQHQAAALVGVNPGRVNEVVKGHSFPKEPPAQGSFPF